MNLDSSAMIRKSPKVILLYVDIVAQVCNLPRDESAVADW